MRIDNVTIQEMFGVLHDKIVYAGSSIKLYNAGGDELCSILYEDVVEQLSTPGNFYFEDINGSKIIRGVVSQSGDADNFKIFDNASGLVVSGSITVLNAGGDITFNSTAWEDGQVVIISSLKIYFSAE